MRIHGSSSLFVLPFRNAKAAAAGIVAGMAVLAAAPAAATILTFQIAGVTNANGQILPDNYGDNVTASPDGNGHSYGFGTEGATPDVTVSYGGTGEVPRVRRDFAPGAYVFYSDNVDTGVTLTTTLTAAPGYLVDLYGFDLAANFATFNINGFTVTDLATSDVLFTSGVIGLQAGVRDSFDFSTLPLSGSQLRILVDLTFDRPGIGSISPGITDIRFGQSLADVQPPAGVPEPATWAMMVLGFGAIGTAARRRDRRPSDRAQVDRSRFWVE
jgi:hypothetical protein